MPNTSFLSIRQSLFSTVPEASKLLGVSDATYRMWELREDAAGPLAAFAALASGLPAPDTRPAAIKAARLAAGLTQAAAAALVGVTVLSWSRWEAGHCRAPMWRLVLFAVRTPPAPTKAAPVPIPVPSREEVRTVREACGLSLAQAARMTYLSTPEAWEVFERYDMRVPIPLYVWELFLRKLPGAALTGGSLPDAPMDGAGLAVARRAAGLTQAAAAALVYMTRDAWANWEGGRTDMPLAAWELFVSSR